MSDKQDIERVSISVPKALRVNMDAKGPKTDWDAVACGAFLRELFAIEFGASTKPTGGVIAGSKPADGFQFNDARAADDVESHDLLDDPSHASHFGAPQGVTGAVMAFTSGLPAAVDLHSTLEVWDWHGYGPFPFTKYNYIRRRSFVLLTPPAFEYPLPIVSSMLIVQTPGGQLPITESKGNPFEPGGRRVMFGAGSLRVQVWYHLKT